MVPCRNRSLVAWRIHTCDMTHGVTRLIQRCDMTCAHELRLFVLSYVETGRVTWLIHTCGMTCSRMGHDSFICVAWLIHVCDLSSIHDLSICAKWIGWRDTCECVILLTHIFDMTHSYVWNDSFICVIWLIDMCEMTHSYVWYNLFICVIWLIHMCDMTHSYV